MKREALAIVAAAGLAAGCAATPDHPAPGFEQHTAPSTVTIPMPEIDLGALPADLPAADAAQIANVVAVHAHDRKRVHDPQLGSIVTDTLHDLSGVRVGANEYLTAGHGVMNGNNTPDEHLGLCGSVVIDTTSLHSTGQLFDGSGRATRVTGHATDSNKVVGSYAQDEYSAVPDVALVQTPNIHPNDPPYDHATQFRTAAAPAVGKPLFFENYEPAADGQVRDPDESKLFPDTTKLVSEGYNRPAVFGGIVVGALANGNLEVVVGEKGYSSPYEAMGRAGESGGPVYDAGGNLVGLSVRGSAPMNVMTMEQQTGKHLSGIPAETQVALEIVQVLSPRLLGQLQRQLQEQPACTPDPLHP